MFHSIFAANQSFFGGGRADQFASSVGRSLLSTTNSMLLRRDLAERKHPTLVFSDWPAEIYANLLRDTSARLNMRIIDDCGHVRELIEVAINKTNVLATN